MRSDGHISTRQAAWCQSTQWRMMARQHCREMNAKRADGPKCGARAKSTGEPCRNTPMTNGRCYRHGGKTPSGAEWHVAQWGDKNRPRALEKALAKAKAKHREALKKERRLALATDEERDAHRQWQKAHKPGSPFERARQRADRKTAAEVRNLLEQPEPSKGINR